MSASVKKRGLTRYSDEEKTGALASSPLPSEPGDEESVKDNGTHAGSVAKISAYTRY
jgi:hypothetical protein